MSTNPTPCSPWHCASLTNCFTPCAGEIPRQMPYEFGLPGHVTQQVGSGSLAAREGLGS